MTLRRRSPSSAFLGVHFLRRYSKAGQVDAQAHVLAKYSLESAFFDYDLAKTSPSLVAAGALAYSLMVLNEKKTLEEVWSPTLDLHVHHEKVKVFQVARKLSLLIATKSKQPIEDKLMSVRVKFSQKKHMRVAQLPSLREHKLL